jgi:predicted metal-dependent hydrolase
VREAEAPGPLPPEPVLSEEDLSALRRGADEFNRGYFFECHDTLEEAWSGIRGEARDFFQGLIQVAVGLYHWRNGNAGGASTMLERGLKRLARYGPSYCGVELDSLRRDAAAARARVQAGEPFPEDLTGLPRYRLREPGTPPD